MRVNNYNAETKKKKKILNIDSNKKSMLNTEDCLVWNFIQLDNLMPSDLQIALALPK